MRAGITRLDVLPFGSCIRELSEGALIVCWSRAKEGGEGYQVKGCQVGGGLRIACAKEGHGGFTLLRPGRPALRGRGFAGGQRVSVERCILLYVEAA
ncbi:MAG: hypothetical protein JWQ71_3379 [Pedosphaera sp.]|nr:hypothetical protein [Pedosphaera sp.]